NVMLAADCLADDVQVMPALREKVLGKLAALLADPAAQVREKAVECHQRLAVTRHREAAAKFITQLALPSDRLHSMAAGHLLSLARALLHVHERDAAAQILSLRKGFQKDELLRLRFEGWPEEGSKIIQEMHEEDRLPITVGSDLTSCRLGPVDLGLIQRLLGRDGLQSLVAKLLEMVQEEERELHSALRWLAALSAQPPSIEMITKLTAADTPPFIRKLAAVHMLNEGHRSHAIAVLQDLCANEPSVAAYAAIALLEADEKSKLDWVLLREISLLANNPDAPEAIRVLLRGDRSDTAVPAALHFLATWRGDHFDLLSVVRDLMEAEQTALGLAAARWLAMRPGFEYRFEACEILLNAERREEARRLLEYLAHECHGEVRLRAYRELQLLGGAEHVIPALVKIATKDTPELRYEVSFSLALAHHLPSTDAVESHRFSLKTAATLSGRTEAYKSALRDFHEAGKAVLKELESTDNRIQAARFLALLSLEYLTGSDQLSGQVREIEDLAMSPWPAVNLNIALFALRTGHVDQARQALTEGFDGFSVNVSAPVFRETLLLASPTFDFASTEFLIDTLQDPGSHLRVAAARALGNIEAGTALQHLTIALGDEDSELRSAAADALGQLRDPAALQPLTAALHDPIRAVRRAATSALGQLRAPAALRPLLTTLGDRSLRVRREGTRALGRLRNSAAVRPLIAALTDRAEEVRVEAVWALGRLRVAAAVGQPLIDALGDDDSNVCCGAAYALGKFRTRTAIEPLLNTLSHDNFNVRKEAAFTLAKLRSPTLAQRLMAMLADERSNKNRSAVAFALARIGNRSVVQPLITALDHETGSRRHFIACVLGQLKQPVALEPLIAALTEDDFIVRHFAAYSLAELRDPAALEPLIAALNDESVGMRLQAATALRNFQGTPTIQPLIGALNDDAGEVRASAAETLGHLRATEAVEALMMTLSADRGDSRDETARALGRIGDGAAIQPLMAMLVDAPASRPAIARALSRLGATEAVPLLAATAQPDAAYLEALIHLDPAGALAVLDRFGQRLRGDSWADRVRGQALWRLGDETGALAALRKATDQVGDEVDNLLALARFHLERGEPEAASELVDRALRHEPYSDIGLLTRAVVLQ
ncbi:MAG: hypothetical protein GY835_18750, partial [bacterium]|nr:hypothetical protein [bacterium]